MVNDQDVQVDQSEARKLYTKPAIIAELKLETRAGTPVLKDPLVDPLGIDPNQPRY
jgi:hypothetical protein